MGTRVQGASGGNAASGTSVGATFGSNVTAGNLIHVFVLFRDVGEGSTNSITDSLGNTYTLIETVTRTNRIMPHYYAKNISGGACTVTLNTPGSNQYRSLAAIEISGLDTTSPLDDFSSNVQETPGTGTDAIVSGTLTASAAGFLSAAGIQVNDIGAGFPPSAGTGFTNDGTALPPVSPDQARLESDDTTAGSYQATFTSTAGNVAHAAIAAIFKDSGGGGSPPVLSAPSSGTVTPVSATPGASTDTTSGTGYVVVDTSANLSGVTAAEIKAGQKAGGAAAFKSGNTSISASPFSISITGLAPSTAYRAAIVQNSTSDSNIVTVDFTTTAHPDPITACFPTGYYE